MSYSFQFFFTFLLLYILHSSILYFRMDLSASSRISPFVRIFTDFGLTLWYFVVSKEYGARGSFTAMSCRSLYLLSFMRSNFVAKGSFTGSSEANASCSSSSERLSGLSIYSFRAAFPLCGRINFNIIENPRRREFKYRHMRVRKYNSPRSKWS